MRIRSITYFVNPGTPLEEKRLEQAGTFLRQARAAFTEAGFEVQTVRLATTPFSALLRGSDVKAAVQAAVRFEQLIQTYAIDYVSLGPAYPECPDCYAWIPDMLAATQSVFFSGSLGTPEKRISLPAVRSCAEVIQRAAPLTPDGFANLRFTALANVQPGSPFFPAAYHIGDDPAFAIATEAADLAVQAFQPGQTLEESRRRLVEAVEENARRLTATAEDLASRFQTRFGGIDFTLAPFPETDRSFGTGLERAGTPAVGMAGTLAAAAILADTLDQARFPRTGFSGLMLPVLEDQRLAERAAEGLLSINDLLLYSAVCGTGLDTLPLPGDATVEQLAAVLLDMAALAYRLDKPLTARLMPIPGKGTGDRTSFDFGYFANSRVLPLRASPLQAPLSGSESFDLRPRSLRRAES